MSVRLLFLLLLFFFLVALKFFPLFMMGRQHAFHFRADGCFFVSTARQKHTHSYLNIQCNTMNTWLAAYFVRVCVFAFVWQVQHILSCTFSALVFFIVYSEIVRNRKNDNANGLHWLRSMLNTLIETCQILWMESKLGSVLRTIKQMNNNSSSSSCTNKGEGARKKYVCVCCASIFHLVHEARTHELPFSIRKKESEQHRKLQPAEKFDQSARSKRKKMLHIFIYTSWRRQTKA